MIDTNRVTFSLEIHHDVEGRSVQIAWLIHGVSTPLKDACGPMSRESRPPNATAYKGTNEVFRRI